MKKNYTYALTTVCIWATMAAVVDKNCGVSQLMKKQKN